MKRAKKSYGVEKKGRGPYVSARCGLRTPPNTGVCQFVPVRGMFARASQERADNE